MVAAYAVALQALISAFVPTAFGTSADPFAILCSHNDTDKPGHPSQQSVPCAAICAAMGHGIAGTVPPDVVLAFAAPDVFATVAQSNPWVQPPVVFARTHAPRGPPFA